MQKFGLVSNKPLSEWQAGIVEILEELSKHEVDGLALVAITRDEDRGEEVLAWYNHMSIRDKQLPASTIQTDVTWAIAQDAIRHYLGEADEEWEE